jgi:hypothetical protein
VKNAVVERYGRTVIAGPFAGMKYIDAASGSAYVPKILGCYEQELHRFVEQIANVGHDTIIGVWCAEGYYAIGFARRCPAAQVSVFDTDEDAREKCIRLASLNEVSIRVDVRGFCYAEDLRALCSGRAFLFCDIEGYEYELLDPSVVPGLATIDMLVELHEPLRPGLTAANLDRFRLTHCVTLVDAKERLPRTIQPSRSFGRQTRTLPLRNLVPLANSSHYSNITHDLITSVRMALPRQVASPGRSAAHVRHSVPLFIPIEARPKPPVRAPTCSLPNPRLQPR